MPFVVVDSTAKRQSCSLYKRRTEHTAAEVSPIRRGVDCGDCGTNAFRAGVDAGIVGSGAGGYCRAYEACSMLKPMAPMTKHTMKQRQ